MTNKWCLNFLSALMLTGGVQRLNLCIVLESPSNIELLNSKDDVIESGLFALQVSFEKRIRTIEFPKFIFPGSMYQAFTFHVTCVLPVLYYKHNAEERYARRKCLNLHTGTGESQGSRHVMATIRRFQKQLDPELKNIASITLRASFACMMLHRPMRGDKLANSDYLAKVMNTSAEQLKKINLLTEGKTFEACAEIQKSRIDGKKGAAKDTVPTLDLL